MKALGRVLELLAPPIATTGDETMFISMRRQMTWRLAKKTKTLFSGMLTRFAARTLTPRGMMVGAPSYRASDVIGVWVLTDDLDYTDVEYGPLGARAGLPTDGASIPRFLWPITGPPLRDWRVAGPAAIHDLLYYLAGQTRFSREDADIIFARALIANNVPHWKALTYYIGVRLGGWIGWRRHGRETEFQARAKEWLIDD